MPRFRRAQSAAAFALVLLCAGCASKPPSPLDLRRCDAVATKGGMTFDFGTRSRATKPIGSFSYAIDFGGRIVGGAATFSPPLEPGQSRDVTVRVRLASAAIRPPTHCSAVRVVYADGTVDETGP